MREHQQRVDHEGRYEPLKPGEISLGNYPTSDCDLPKETRYRIGYGPTAEEFGREILASGKYERVRLALAHDLNGNVLHDMELVIALPKVIPIQK